MRLFRRKPPPRRHPTPAQAAGALAQGSCMYAPTRSACSGQPGHVGLRTADDTNTILVCGAHYGRLRKIPARDLDRLERTLLDAFTRPPAPAAEHDDRPLLVHVRRA